MSAAPLHSSPVDTDAAEPQLEGVSMSRNPLPFLWMTDRNTFPFREDTVVLVPSVVDFEDQIFNVSVNVRRSHPDSVPANFIQEDLPQELLERIEELRSEGAKMHWVLLDVRLMQPSDVYGSRSAYSPSLASSSRKGAVPLSEKESLQRTKQREAKRRIASPKEEASSPHGKARKLQPVTVSPALTQAPDLVLAQEREHSESTAGSTEEELTGAQKQEADARMQAILNKFRKQGYKV